MPQYTGIQSMLDASLGEYADQGFTLDQLDDDFLKLSFKGHRVAIFTQHVTIQVIHNKCRAYLSQLASVEVAANMDDYWKNQSGGN